METPLLMETKSDNTRGRDQSPWLLSFHVGRYADMASIHRGIGRVHGSTESSLND